MSGTFQDIDVPPTLVSFAVDVAKSGDVVTPEFKCAGNKIVLIRTARDEYELPDFSDIKKQYAAFKKDIEKGAVLSAYALDANGIAPALCKMAFGNGLGVKITDDIELSELFTPEIGSLVAEVPAEEVTGLNVKYTVIGEVTDKAEFAYKNAVVSDADALSAWKKTLERTFPTESGENIDVLPDSTYNNGSVYVCTHKIGTPSVFIPVFPGTNCEYDSAAAFKRAGANVDIKVFKNQSAQDIVDSVEIFRKSIDKAQMIMFPGGFSAGDEPDGSAKFFATAFRNAALKEAIESLLEERDGLVLGICNGFQALIKLGLVPDGKITGQNTKSPTLTYNRINRHVSKMAYTKVVSNLSPWLSGAQLGGTYVIPVSHGEGRFVADDDVIEKLFANGQVATRYCNNDGVVSMDEEYNVNASYMAIEGITSPDGRVFGKMGHSERRGDYVAMNIYGQQDMQIFESGVRYFK